MGRHGSRCAWPLTAPRTSRRLAMECLDRVGLADYADRRVDTLSGGQQQRVAIARMLMQQPRVILADEPVASLDPASANSVMDLMCAIAAERGVTVIVALHQIELALRYADRVVGLRDGVVEFDRPARIAMPHSWVRSTPRRCREQRDASRRQTGPICPRGCVDRVC